MSTQVKVSDKTSNYSGLEILEILSVIGSFGGSVAAVIFQQLAFASVPLSLSVALNLVNRKQLFNSVIQSQQANQNILSEQIQEVQLSNNVLSTRIQDIQGQTTVVNDKQKQLIEVIGCLRNIENFNGVVQVEPNSPQSYYQRGLNHQRLGNKEAAISDYTEAIRLNQEYAPAYCSRGLVRSQQGDKQGAVKDFRTAAKFFFEQGDIENYQKSKNLNNRLYDLSSLSETNSSEVEALESLFA